MKQWLLGIVLAALAGGLARDLAPKGREQALVRLAAGLLLALAILRPLAGFAGVDLLPAGGEPLRDQAERQAEIYREDARDALAAVIEERTGAYIWDKANQLGLSCEVSVSTAAGEDGIPLPDTVTIRGCRSAALEAWLREEVGLPAGKIIWQEDVPWTEGS